MARTPKAAAAALVPTPADQDEKVAAQKALDAQIIELLKVWAAGSALNKVEDGISGVKAKLLAAVGDNPFSLPRAKGIVAALGDSITVQQGKMIVQILAVGKSTYEKVTEAANDIRTNKSTSRNAAQIASAMLAKVVEGVDVAKAIEAVDEDNKARTKADLGLALIERIKTMLKDGADNIAAIKLVDEKEQKKLDVAVANFKAFAAPTAK